MKKLLLYTSIAFMLTACEPATTAPKTPYDMELNTIEVDGNLYHVTYSTTQTNDYHIASDTFEVGYSTFMNITETPDPNDLFITAQPNVYYNSASEHLDQYLTSLDHYVHYTDTVLAGLRMEYRVFENMAATSWESYYGNNSASILNISNISYNSAMGGYDFDLVFRVAVANNWVEKTIEGKIRPFFKTL